MVSVERSCRRQLRLRAEGPNLVPRLFRYYFVDGTHSDPTKDWHFCYPEWNKEADVSVDHSWASRAYTYDKGKKNPDRVNCLGLPEVFLEFFVSRRSGSFYFPYRAWQGALVWFHDMTGYWATYNGVDSIAGQPLWLKLAPRPTACITIGSSGVVVGDGGDGPIGPLSATGVPDATTPFLTEFNFDAELLYPRPEFLVQLQIATRPC